MITVEKYLYEYEDLLKPENSGLLDKIVSNWDEDYFYLYDEVKNTIDSFIDKFPFEITTYNSFFEPNLNYIDNNILDLEGLRLRTWIINNLTFLFKPKYIGSLKTNEYVRHKRVKSPINANKYGNRHNAYYSGVFKDNSCVLTGVCYDDYFLKPIYDFIEKPNNYNIEDLIKECFNSLELALNNEIEYRNSKESILETIEANNYTFNEYGKIEY